MKYKIYIIFYVLLVNFLNTFFTVKFRATFKTRPVIVYTSFFIKVLVSDNLKKKIADAVAEQSSTNGEEKDRIVIFGK